MSSWRMELLSILWGNYFRWTNRKNNPVKSFRENNVSRRKIITHFLAQQIWEFFLLYIQEKKYLNLNAACFKLLLLKTGGKLYMDTKAKVSCKKTKEKEFLSQKKLSSQFRFFKLIISYQSNITSPRIKVKAWEALMPVKQILTRENKYYNAITPKEILR